jgi:hypothetical protein
MATQAQIDSLLQQFMHRYNGQKPDYWGYPGECLSLNKRWVDILVNGRLDGPMQAPASNNGYGTGYWVSPPALINQLFVKQNYDPNASYPAGSMFTYMSSGHIGIMMNNQPGSGTALVYQQNADPDGSPAHLAQRAKSRINGILVLKVDAPAPPPSQPTQGAIEMINTAEEGRLSYKVLRPNYEPTQDELNATVGKRTYKQFMTDGIREREQRDAALVAQNQALAHAQSEAQNLRNAIAELQHLEAQEDVTEAQKTAELNDLTTKLSSVTSDLQKALLEVERLNNVVCKVPEKQVPETLDWIEKFFTLFMRKAK